MRDMEGDLAVTTRRFTWTNALILLVLGLSSYDVPMVLFFFVAQSILLDPRELEDGVSCRC